MNKKILIIILLIFLMDVYMFFGTTNNTINETKSQPLPKPSISIEMGQTVVNYCVLDPTINVGKKCIEKLEKIKEEYSNTTY